MASAHRKGRFAPPFSPAKASGFSLVEVITVLVILSILAVVAMPRFTGNSGFSERAAQDQIIALARYAQQLAMTRGASDTVTFILNGNSLQVAIDGAPAVLPGGTSTSRVFEHVAISNTSLAYSALGETTATTLTITGEASRQVCIESTGYAHAC